MDATLHYEKIRAILKKQFGHLASESELIQAAKKIFAITAEEDLEWEEVAIPSEEMGYSVSSECENICRLAEIVADGGQVRILRRK